MAASLNVTPLCLLPLFTYSSRTWKIDPCLLIRKASISRLTGCHPACRRAEFQLNSLVHRKHLADAMRTTRRFFCLPSSRACRRPQQHMRAVAREVFEVHNSGEKQQSNRITSSLRRDICPPLTLSVDVGIDPDTGLKLPIYKTIQYQYHLDRKVQFYSSAPGTNTTRSDI